MRKGFAIALLIVGAWCLIKAEHECRADVATKFEAFYVRMVRIGEDNYEEFDQGTIAYDGPGKRMAFQTSSRSDSRRVLKEYICKDSDPNSQTGFKSIAVLLTGQCQVRPVRFYYIGVPKEDDYLKQIRVGGPDEGMEEDVFVGESSRGRNDFIVTAYDCGPVEFAFSDHERNYHVRMQLFNLTLIATTDVWKISCPGQTAYLCEPTVDF